VQGDKKSPASNLSSHERHCRAHDPTDTLDLELAQRLNEWLAGSNSDEDHSKPLGVAIVKVFCWALLVGAAAVVAIRLLT
jgi:hypothetical protein